MLTNQKSPTRWWRNGAVLVMRNGYDGKYKLNIRGLRGQPLYDEEVIPIGTPEYLDTDEYRDTSFEEIIHLVKDTGIGIDIEGYDEGAAPEFQSEIRTALNNAHFTINCGVMETKEERDG